MTEPTEVPPETPPGPARPRRPWRLMTAAAAATGALTLVGVATAHATPHSPLWSLATIAFPQHTTEILAEQELQAARQAAVDGRLGDSSQHLDQAALLLGTVGTNARAQQLRDEIDALRLALSHAQPAIPLAGPAGNVPDNAPAPGRRTDLTSVGSVGRC